MDYDDYNVNEDDDEVIYEVYEENENENENNSDDEDYILNNKKKEKEDSDDEEEDDDQSENEIYNEFETENINSVNIYPFITKYELSRVLESMCLMISDPKFIIPPEIPKNIYGILEICEYWIFKTNPQIPVDIVRPLFNNKKIIVNVRNLKIPKHLLN